MFFTRSKLSSIGERVYELNKDILERDYMGKVVALCKKGVTGIGDGLEEAYKKLGKGIRRKHSISEGLDHAQQ